MHSNLYYFIFFFNFFFFFVNSISIEPNSFGTISTTIVFLKGNETFDLGLYTYTESKVIIEKNEYLCIFQSNTNNQIKSSCSGFPNASTTLAMYQVGLKLNLETPIQLNFPITIISLNQTIIQDGAYFRLYGNQLSSLDPTLLKVNLSNQQYTIVNITSEQLLVSGDGLPISDIASFSIVYNGQSVYNLTKTNVVTYITSSIPSYLINTNNSLTLNVMGLNGNVQDAKVFIFDLVTWISLVFTFNSVNQIFIEPKEISAFYGERLVRVENIQTLDLSNIISVGFATPIINRVSINATTRVVLAEGKFLNNTNYPTLFRGVVLQPVYPSSTTDTTLTYDNPELIRNTVYLQCGESYSTNYTYFTLVSPKVTVFGSIYRKGGLYYFSGQNLQPFTEDHTPTYSLAFSNSNSEKINCTDIRILKFWGNQEYNASCMINDYLYSEVSTLIVSTYPSGSSSTNFLEVYIPPTITNITSTFYGIPSYVIINGLSFCPQPFITIGGSSCSLISSDMENGVIVCDFPSDAKGLDVAHKVNISCSSQSSVTDIFWYLVDECSLSVNSSSNGLMCSGNGICNQSDRTCICDTNFSGIDCSVSSPPIVLSSSSTFFGMPEKVIITGSSFCTSPSISIGGSDCFLVSSDQINQVIVCNFTSNVQGLYSVHRVNVTCGKLFGCADLFVYKVDECLLSTNNGVVCSGDGVCDQTIRKCICNQGYSGFDCSVDNNGGGNTSPIIDNTTTIIETEGSRFDIGLVQIRELSFSQEITIAYNLTVIDWSLDKENSSNTQFIYTATLPNKSGVKAILTVNSDSKQSKQYDFYGDIITLLPNSVKYQIEISNWSFQYMLNSLELIFQSQISFEQCDSTVLQGEKKVQMYGDSIRSVELTLKNGQTLVGTFSNRMKLDDNLVISSIKILSDQQSIGIPSLKLSTSSVDSEIKLTKSVQNVYTSISIGWFKDRATIDPNFGVLFSSDINPKDTECSNDNKFAGWKIALIVVFSFVSISLVIVGIMVYRTRNRNLLVINGVKLNLKDGPKNK